MGNKGSREQVIDDIDTHNNVLDIRRNVSRNSHDKVKKKKKPKHEDPYLKLEKYKHPYEDGQSSFLLNDESVEKLSIGQGSFGIVYKGCILLNDDYNGQGFGVAIKQYTRCKDDDFADAFKEISALQKSIHSNIVQFFEIIADPLCVVMELCEISLLQRLKEQPWLSVTRILDYAQQICSGMSYLESKSCVHRDLAARNILLTNNEQIAKISDFGMARFLSDSESCYPIRDNDVFPVRSAPEVLLRKEFSHKSDVWAFGVTLWEMFEHEKMPRETAESNAIIRKDIIDGKMLKKPENLSKEICDIMRLCWTYHPDYRPTFTELIVMLNDVKISYKIRPKTSLQRYFPKFSITCGHPKQRLPSPSFPISEYETPIQSLSIKRKNLLKSNKSNLEMEERELYYETTSLHSGSQDISKDDSETTSDFIVRHNVKISDEEPPLYAMDIYFDSSSMKSSTANYHQILSDSTKEFLKDTETISLIEKSMENLDLSAQNNCPLRKSKSMGNMLSCGGNFLTKHTEAGNQDITISQGLQHEKLANELSSNLEFDELTKQLQRMARKMKTRSRGSRRIVRNLRPSKINQSSLHKNNRRKRFSCAAQNANQFFNNTGMIMHSDDQNDHGENISQNTTNQLSSMLSPLQTHQSQCPQIPHVLISQQQQPNIPPNSHMMTTQQSPNQRTVNRASPSLASSSSDYYANSMSDPASAGPTASIQHPPIPYQQTANVTNVPTTYHSTFITTPPAASSSIGRPFLQVPPRANFTVNPTVPSGPNDEVNMYPDSFGNVSISQSSNFGRPLHAPQVPPHQPTPPTNIAAFPLVNVPVHPSHLNTASPSLFNSASYSSESDSPFLQPHALQTQFTPQISYSFELAPSRSVSLNSDQNQNSAAIGSAISQFTFNPNNFALNQANTSSTNLYQKHHMMTTDSDQPTTSQRSSLIFTPRCQPIHWHPFSSDSSSNHFPSTSSNLTSSHDSIATHMDTSDNQTTSSSDIPIGGNNTKSRKRPNTNGNNRSRKTECIKQDKSEIEKKNRETTRRLQIKILEKSDENNKKIEEKINNLSQDIGNVDKKIDNLSQDIMKNLMQNFSQLYLSHASGNACNCSSQSIPSNSISAPIHNTAHLTQNGTTSCSYMDQFHQQEPIIRCSSSGCSSDNDIGSLLNI